MVVAHIFGYCACGRFPNDTSSTGSPGEPLGRPRRRSVRKQDGRGSDLPTALPPLAKHVAQD
jgi:hypothetical protein